MKNRRTSNGVNMSSAAALNTCLIRSLSSAICRVAGSHRAQHESEFCPKNEDNPKGWQSPGRSDIFRQLVGCDPFLSQLLCHSHQVSGVWVTKTAKRQKKRAKIRHFFYTFTPGMWRPFLNARLALSVHTMDFPDTWKSRPGGNLVTLAPGFLFQGSILISKWLGVI